MAGAGTDSRSATLCAYSDRVSRRTRRGPGCSSPVQLGTAVVVGGAPIGGTVAGPLPPAPLPTGPLPAPPGEGDPWPPRGDLPSPTTPVQPSGSARASRIRGAVTAARCVI
jgi:hypothetical protein